MPHVTIYDCEFLTAPGAPQRFWCGPTDPDPLTIQIGAVRLNLHAPYSISAPESWLVTPVDRDGHVVSLDPLVTRLTGLTDAMIAADGIALIDAMRALDAYSLGSPLLAWGKDEVLSLAASLFVADVASPIAAKRFRSAVPMVVAAGEAQETVESLRSHTICDHFGLTSQGCAHDASGDAQAVAVTLQHLLNTGRLTASHFEDLAAA